MREHCPASAPKFAAVLPNYKLVFTGWSRQWRGAVASLKFLKGDRVRGAVYEVDEHCLRQLDRHEAGYTRLNVTVFNQDDEPVPAVTHIKSGRIDEGRPSAEYLAVIQQGLRDWRLF